MALRKITGTKTLVDLQRDLRTGDDPSVTVNEHSRLFLKMVALRLLGLTGLTDPTQVTAIRAATAQIVDIDDKNWTVDDAQKILSAAGTLPAPSHVQVWRLPGQGTILMRVVLPGTPKARRLTYVEGRASISVLAALRPEGIVIPKGMCMDVPVKLVEEEDGLLSVAIFFRRGTLRDLEPAEGETAATSQVPGGEQKDS